METDPVCGARIRPGQEAGSTTYQGKTYRFCSTECRREFERKPKQYTTATASTA